MMSTAKVYSDTAVFDIRDLVVYPKEGEHFNPSINVTDKELTFHRCRMCHACSFDDAFDYDNYDTDKWNPHYVGEDWEPVINRMNANESALLNEQIAERIFNFLRDVTTGKYKEEEDTKGAIVVEKDPEEEDKGNYSSDIIFPERD